MALSLWLTLLVACVVISFTPGAGAINTMGNALNHGFRRAIWGILGQQAALIVHIAIVALGVGVAGPGSSLGPQPAIAMARTSRWPRLRGVGLCDARAGRSASSICARRSAGAACQ